MQFKKIKLITLLLIIFTSFHLCSCSTHDAYEYAKSYEATDEEPYTLDYNIDGEQFITCHQAGTYNAFVQIKPSPNLTKTFDFDIIAGENETTPDYILPSQLTTIESEAFKGVPAKKVKLPTGVTYEEDSFEDDVELIY